MTDEEYLFRQTEKERKRAGYGAFHKKSGAKSSYVSLPSDKLTRKERLAMNGECKSFNLAKPTTWEEFRRWPQDVQAEYVRKLEADYKATSPMIAKMLGVSHDYFRNFRAKAGYPATRGGFRNPDMAAWERFLAQEAEGMGEAEKPVEAVPTPQATLVPQEIVKAAVDEHGVPTITLDMACEEKNSKAEEIGALIAALAGTGAKLTIELTL